MTDLEFAEHLMRVTQIQMGLRNRRRITFEKYKGGYSCPQHPILGTFRDLASLIADVMDEEGWLRHPTKKRK